MSLGWTPEGETLARLDSRSQRLALALAKGATQEQACREAGVSRSTTKRRLRDPKFRQAVTDLRGEMFNAAVGLAVANLAGAISRLATLMDDPQAPHHVSVTAARAVVEATVRLREQGELAARLERLEQRLGDPPPRPYPVSIPAAR